MSDSAFTNKEVERLARLEEQMKYTNSELRDLKEEQKNLVHEIQKMNERLQEHLRSNEKLRYDIKLLGDTVANQSIELGKLEQKVSKNTKFIDRVDFAWKIALFVTSTNAAGIVYQLLSHIV